jgi:hypothetical protein
MRRDGILFRAVARWGALVISLGTAVTVSGAQTVTTYAASGVSQSVQTAAFIGTSSMAGAGTGSFATGAGDAVRGGGDSATHAAKASRDVTTPNPSGLNVTTSGGFTGFDGLNHRDQRVAGTGIYTNTQFSLEPPDQGLCVGNGYVLESVNTAFQVFNTAGTALTSPEAFNQFFGVAPEVIRKTPPALSVVGDFLSDPKCNYDAATGRWFMTILQVDPPGLCNVGDFGSVVPCPGSRAHTFVAVSQSGDPRGSWNLFKIDATDDGLNGTPNHANSIISCPCFGDQPLLGMNADALFISTNEYGIALTGNTNPGNPEFGAQIYAVSKRGLEQATRRSLPKVVHIDAGALPMPSGDCCAPWDSIQPATSPTASQQTRGFEYFLSSFTNNTTTNHAINAWVVTGTGTLQRSHPDLDIQRVQLRSEAYVDDLPISSPGFGGIAVDQKTGSHPLGESLGDSLGQINANDVRMNQVVYANGKLWAGLNTALQSTSGGPARSGIAYFVVQPSLGDGELQAEMVNQGYVTVAGNSTLFPSIGVNASGEGAIAFSVVGPDYFPSAAYVRINSDGDLSGPIVIAGAGNLPDDGFTQYPQETFGGAPVGRWGDYSAAVAGPDGSIWMAAEYIHVTASRPRTVLANWGTFVYHLNVDDNQSGSQN